MKIKAKVENHFKEHKREIFTAAVGGVMLATGFALGYKAGFALGYKACLSNYNKGLGLCLEAKPELEPMLWEAINLVKNKG